MAKPSDKLLDHNYDGILEYDNPLPRWWVYLFIITVIWGAIYFWYYHISDRGMSSAQQYLAEVREAEESGAVQKIVFDKKDFVVITDEASLADGKMIYEKNCATCHGRSAEGGVGPNLTDEYWIHGGTFENIAVIIAVGVPEKAMPSWQTQLSKKDVLATASFIKLLKGSNPANPKPPQGDLYKGE